MEETLKKRLEILVDAIQQQDVQIQKMIANRNMLDGARQEVTLLMSILSSECKPKDNVIANMSIEEFQAKVSDITTDAA